jgi:hypothetical protein
MSKFWEKLEVPHCNRTNCKGRAVHPILALWIVAFIGRELPFHVLYKSGHSLKRLRHCHLCADFFFGCNAANLRATALVRLPFHTKPILSSRRLRSLPIFFLRRRCTVIQ